MRVLVGCEYSQAVTKEFRRLGHEAYSCDLLPTDGNPDWHFQESIFDVLDREYFDLGIFHPPCTYLTVTGNGWFNVEKYGDKAIKRIYDRHDALGFVLRLYYCRIKKVAIENPIGYLSSAFREPDQVIQPYYFGDPERKATCLWLKNLPPLEYKLTNDLFGPATAVEPNIVTLYSKKTGRKLTYSEFEYKASFNKAERAHIRSKTFPGIARAMAEQWGESPSIFPAALNADRVEDMPLFRAAMETGTRHGAE